MKRKHFVYVFMGTIVVPTMLASSFIWLLVQPPIKRTETVSPTITINHSSKPTELRGGWGRRALGLPF